MWFVLCRLPSVSVLHDSSLVWSLKWILGHGFRVSSAISSAACVASEGK